MNGSVHKTTFAMDAFGLTLLDTSALDIRSHLLADVTSAVAIPHLGVPVLVHPPGGGLVYNVATNLGFLYGDSQHMSVHHSAK